MGTIITLIAIAIAAFYLIKRSLEHNKEVERQQIQRVKADADAFKELKKEAARIQAFIQAGIVGDQRAVDDINAGCYNGPLPERRSDGGWLSIYENLRILNIAGINYRSNIAKYVGRVECALVPEPENEFDKNAIKVVAEDRHHLGYIPSNQTDFVRSLTANEFPYRCTAFIHDAEDEDDGHKFFVGHVYIKRLD